jgi:hypothetical protein
MLTSRAAGLDVDRVTSGPRSAVLGDQGDVSLFELLQRFCQLGPGPVVEFGSRLLLETSPHCRPLFAQRADLRARGQETDGWPADPAIAAVLATPCPPRRGAKLAAADPQMAREFNIGRPDLVRSYDDGGLVDRHTVPYVLIASTCGIELAVAEQIVAARFAGVPFSTVDVVFSLAESATEQSSSPDSTAHRP